MSARQAWRALRAQARIELVLASRRTENLFVTLAVPLVLLVFLAMVPVLPAARGASAVEALVPPILTVAVISTGLVALGI
ncbi:MAG: hypothetical protein M3301_06415, partial [Chloroflexota bacterium]|nr:hypothetical protein [Chloroflexota bacterium]